MRRTSREESKVEENEPERLKIRVGENELERVKTRVEENEPERVKSKVEVQNQNCGERAENNPKKTS